MAAARTLQPGEISICIICPLPIEVAAMIQMLDERYSTQRYPRDPNIYHQGLIGEHYVVIAGLPDGLTGIASATTVAEQLWITFSSVKALLLVGIGGGVPTTKNDMRLGDIVVSRPDGKYGGVVQYDFGKSLSEGRFEHTGTLNSPPRELLSTLATMKANNLVNSTRLPGYLEQSQSNPHLKNPGAETDILFEADYNHAGGSDCTGCDKAREIKRDLRKANGPVIHYGTIASANQLMRDAKKRDSYNQEYNGRILCFEMEAAGLMNSTPCLVVRGISDYADSHKREDHAWHGYAAAAAAAFAKEFINTMPGSDLRSMSTVPEAIAKDVTNKVVGVQDWSEEINYEKLTRIPEVKDRLALYGKAIFAPASVGHAMSSIGLHVTKARSETLSRPCGNVLVSVLGYITRSRLTIKSVQQSSEAVVLVCKIPTDLWSFRGELVITVARAQTQTKVDAATRIPGQMYDWGKSKRVLEALFDAIRKDI